ncbi:MAG: AbrB/MazE/SpoVT family DNA-binding domain-containing protein [Thermoproteota archaeon]|jgi:AbrB family looped-hinge helix DNA binding protein
MEIKIGNKGRITLPLKLRELLGLREGDSLVVEVTNKGILLKPKGPSSRELWGVARLEKVEIEEIEESLGREN